MSLIGLGTLLTLALIFYFSRKRQATTKIAAWIAGSLARLSRGRWKFERLKHSAEKMLKAFHDGIDTLIAQKSRLVLPVSLSIFAWALDLLISVFVFQALDALRSFSLVAIVYSISVAIQTIPIGVPGEVGVLDIVMTSLYTLLGVDITIAAVATVLIRILTLWLRLLIGGLTVQWLGIKGFKPPGTAA